MAKYLTVDDYILQQTQWQKQLKKLRAVILSTSLIETIKWGAPCYTYQSKNLIGMAAFKNAIGLWFHQGALLTDPENLLINAQEGKTKALRQWRIKTTADVKAITLKAYIEESKSFIDQGISIPIERNKTFVIPHQLKHVMENNPIAQQHFFDLTLGKQREYAEYIQDAKRDNTKQKRLEKIIPMIELGVGLNDKYR